MRHPEIWKNSRRGLRVLMIGRLVFDDFASKQFLVSFFPQVFLVKEKRSFQDWRRIVFERDENNFRTHFRVKGRTH